MHTIDGQAINYKDVYSVMSLGAKVSLGSRALGRVKKTREAIEKSIDNNEVIYGVTTGFGAFKNTSISGDKVARLQENLIKSHATGVGEPLDEPVVRGMIFLMANYLSKGHSGVRPVVIQTLIRMLNKNVYPVVPEKGSVGSSGDLAPSAHIILVMIGSGEAYYQGKRISGALAMKRAGIKPIRLAAKEGLALINNTACMSSIACLNLMAAHQLVEWADYSGALSAEALRATPKAFDKDVHSLKPHKGQIVVAARLRRLLSGSKMLDQKRIQDQYSIRCMPQVHGAVREALSYVERIVETEINSVTDNPLIFRHKKGAKVISAGNFHGEALAIAMDTLGIALSELANISDRRIASLVDAANSNGLPAFLAENGGLNSGMMILQYTTAALVSENKVLAHPASVDSVPTSANVEDFVSMGTIAARKARDIADNVRNVLAIELLVAAQAVDFRLRDGSTLGKGTAGVYKFVRSQVPFFEQDEVYYPYVVSLATAVGSSSKLKWMP